MLKTASFCLRTASFVSKQGQEPSQGLSKSSSFVLEDSLFGVQAGPGAQLGVQGYSNICSFLLENSPIGGSGRSQQTPTS